MLGACDWEGYLTYVSVGWEGSAHDGMVFINGVKDGFELPPCYFYLADGGFPCTEILPTKDRCLQLSSRMEEHGKLVTL